MSVSRVVAADLFDAMRGYLTHKRFIRSRSLEDRESFLKDPLWHSISSKTLCSGLIDFGAGVSLKEWKLQGLMASGIFFTHTMHCGKNH
jgi:hypothetical protein